MKGGFVEPDLVVDIKAISGLGDIAETADGFSIGSAVPCAAMGESTALKKAWPGVVEAANLIGSKQEQGRCTVNLKDFRENTLQDVITKLEPDLFLAVTGLTVADFHLLVRLKVFNTERMNEAVFAFRRYDDASLRYTGIESHEGLIHYGLYDTVVARE
jgi:hypothetical protein